MFLGFPQPVPPACRAGIQQLTSRIAQSRSTSGLVTYVHVPIWIANNSEVTDTAQKAVFARLSLGPDPSSGTGVKESAR
jgi:hypothetical protein